MEVLALRAMQEHIHSPPLVRILSAQAVIQVHGQVSWGRHLLVYAKVAMQEHGHQLRALRPKHPAFYVTLARGHLLLGRKIILLA